MTIKTPLNEGNESLVEILKDQVKKNPDYIIIEDKSRSLTYRELDEKAMVVKRWLQEHDVIREEIVTVYTETSIEQIICIIGIIYAGCAYLPIESKTPFEVVKRMISDSSSRIILCENAEYLQDHFDEDQLLVSPKDVIQSVSTDIFKIDEPEITPYNLAYVMYTSGSTGHPKGVMIEHRNIIRLTKEKGLMPNMSDSEVLIQTAPVEFDASTFEIWFTLFNRVKIIVSSYNDLLNVMAFKSRVKRYQVTVLWLTAPLFHLLAENSPDLFNTIKYLLVGGDVVLPQFVNKIYDQNSQITIINGYGPTENTTFSTFYVIERGIKNGIPIGIPLHFSTAYIFNDQLQQVDDGEIGELYVGGEGVARGYLNNEKLTMEKFTTHPENPAERLYKTGDLVKSGNNGNLIFIGRRDRQVKIRGHRVELNEIECIFREAINSDQVYAKAIEGTYGKKLVIFYETDTNIDLIQFKEQLSKRVPKYKIPDEIIGIDEFPLKPNGKVDLNQCIKIAGL